MIALLRKKRAPEQAPQQPPAAIQPAVTAEFDRLLLLVPEGSYTFRLEAFLDVKSAAEYVDRHLLPGQAFHAVWASDPDDTRGRRQPGEALVLVPDDRRPDIVRPYSFIDVDAARSFLAGGGDEAGEAERPLLFWAESVSVPRGLTVPAPEPARAAPREPVVAYSPSASRQPTPAALYSVGSGAAAAAPAAAPAIEAQPGPPGVLSRVSDWPGWYGLGPRIVAASRAQKKVYYDAVDDDPYAAGRAAVIVLAGAFCAGLSALGDGVFAPLSLFAGALLGWSLSVSAVFVTATVLFHGKRPPNSYRRLAVALGLAYSPAMLLVLGVVPVYGPMFTLAVLGWLAVTAVIAVEIALELDRDTALLTAVPGWMFLFALTLIGPQLVT